VLVVGLTGGIGTGKTTVAHLLAARGASVVDCDALGRLVIEPGGRAYPKVIARFGPQIVRDDRTIDRAAVAAIVFNNPDALADLNGISHPAIDAEIAERIAAARSANARIVVLDMAVLVETKLGQGQYDAVVVVEAPLEVRLIRLAHRGMIEADARARIASQASDTDRRAVADYVVDNGGDLAHLERQVDELWPKLLARESKGQS
jgi:dephospho-CoA kinase